MKPTLCLFFALSSATAPEWVRLAQWGKNPSVKGDYILEKASAQQALKAFEAYGNDLVVDFEHQSLSPVTNGPVPVAGWIRQGSIVLKDDGLWAKVEWTQEAKGLIESKKYRYYSPSFMLNSKGEIVEILPLALTNYPATLNLAPLVASKLRKNNRMELEEALAKALSDALGKACTVDAVYPGKVAYTDADGNKGEMAYSFDGDTIKLKLATPETAGAKQPPQAVTQSQNSQTVQTIQTVQSSKLLALTGKATETEAVATIEAWKDSASQVAKLSARLAEIESRDEAREFEALFAKGKASGQITPGNEGKLKTKGIEFLRAYLETAPAVYNPTQYTAAPKEVELTPEEQAICKTKGRDPKAFAEHKKQLTARKGA